MLKKLRVLTLTLFIVSLATSMGQELALIETFSGPEGYELYTMDQDDNGQCYFLSKNNAAIIALDEEFTVLAEIPDSISGCGINDVFDITYNDNKLYIPVMTSQNKGQIIVYDLDGEDFSILFDDDFAASYFAKKDIIASVAFYNQTLVCGILGSRKVKAFNMEDGSLIGWTKASAYGNQGLKNIELIPGADYDEENSFFTTSFSSGDTYKLTKWYGGNLGSESGIESYRTRTMMSSSMLAKADFYKTVVMVEGAKIEDAIDIQVTSDRIILYDNNENKVLSYSHNLNIFNSESFSLASIIPLESPHYSAIKKSGNFYYVLETTENSVYKIGDNDIEEYDPPVAVAKATPATMLNLNSEVIVTGEESTDPNEKDLSFTWDKLSGAEIEGLTFPVQDTVFAFSSAEAGEYVFELTVSNLYYSDKDTITVAFGDFPDVTKTFQGTEVVQKDGEPVSGLIFKPAVFLDEGKTIWLAGDSYDTTHVYLSVDSGATFTKVAHVLASSSNIAALSADEAFISGTDGHIYHTSDGGTTWASVFSYEKSDGNVGYFNGLIAVDENVLVATGSGAEDGEFFIFRSEDKGATWTEITDIDDTKLAKFSYASYGKSICSVGDHVWCTAYDGPKDNNYIFYSADAGLTWKVIEPGANKRIKSIDFVNETTGILVDDYKTIMITTDGGETWNEPESTPEGLNAFGAASIPGTDYLVVTGGRGSGYDGPTGAFYTKDTGKSWIYIDCPDDDSHPNAYGATFQSIDHAFLFSYRGPLFSLQEEIEEETRKLSLDITKKPLLANNYPNPFNPSTIIQFTIKERSQVKIDIFNLLGEKVTTLADEEFNPGTHKVRWKAESNGTGVYFYQIKTQNHTIRKSMTLIK